MPFLNKITRFFLLATTLTTALQAEDVKITYDVADKVPISVVSYQAVGKMIDFTLDMHPGVGTDLTVIENTGTGFIDGNFSNMPHGQLVHLEHQGIIYSFVANYYAGTGNDLILQWANRKLVGWGDNQKGQLGNRGSGKTGPGVWVDTSGVLAGKVITQVAVGAAHAVALCSDGTLAAWGYNYYGQLGDGTAYDTSRPVLIKRTGVLANKIVIKIACGEYHSLALCSDGTLATWGTNQSAQLGDGTTVSRTSPVAVDRSGILAGKTVVAIAAAQFHNLVLCSDGSMATWGGNTNGKLGNGGTAASLVPVSVVRSGVLAGKTVSSLAVGSQHSLVLCTDGTLASWGANSFGQLGNSSVASSNVPVLVRTNGVLAGRTPINIAAGNVHSLALCSDGFLAGWGGNGSKQLGSSSSATPIAMPSAGALSGRRISRFEGGTGHTVVFCNDSAIVAWGNNQYGELAQDTGFSVTSTLPLLADRITLPSSSRFVGVNSGFLSFSNIATVALPVPPVAKTLAASQITDTSATLSAQVNPAGASCTVRFEYGPTEQYGSTTNASPETLAGILQVNLSAPLKDLLPDTTYHYRVVVTFPGGTLYGMDTTFKTTDAASLASLGTGFGSVHPPVSPRQTRYHLIVPNEMNEIVVTPVATHAESTIRLNGKPISPATPGSTLALAVGLNDFGIEISSADGINHLTYTLHVTRLPDSLVVDSAGAAPVIIKGGIIPAVSTRVILNYKPLTGDNLTLIRHDGTDLLQGAFANLLQGEIVRLDHGGNTYYFIANYAGGDGNDLVLQWKNSRLMGWGYNNLGQLGTGGTTNRNSPAAVTMTGVLAGKTISRLSAGEYHSIALCTDGTLAAWGSNQQGELGANSSAYSIANPTLVDRTGALVGKRVVDVGAGGYFSAALCSDGTVATWGAGISGALGNNDTRDSAIPVAVDTTGVLNGRRVVAISVGSAHMLVLCSDGTLVTWGNNQSGQIGTGNPVEPFQSYPSLVPFQVVRGITSGKTISSISAGGYHNQVAFTDGSLAAWGANSDGQLGNNSNTTSSLPVWVDRAGVLSGKTPKSLLAASYSSLAFCTDGTIATWGAISGNNVPVRFPYAGALTGKSVLSVIGKSGHFHAICSDGSMAGWGGNFYGQVGNGNNNTSDTPSQVSTVALRTGEVFVAGSSASFHSLALVASPLQVPATLAATTISGTSATLRGSVDPNNNLVSLQFEYGLDTSYGKRNAATPPSASGTLSASPNAVVSGLTPGTTYHYRLVASGEHAVMRGVDMSFTTLSDNSHLAGIGLEAGVLSPKFVRNQTSYIATVPHEALSIRLTPLAEHAGATVRVNDSSANNAIPLSVGQNIVKIVVTAEDGIARMTYTVEITRLPASFRFDTARDVPLTVDRLALGPLDIRFELGFAPAPGVILTAINVKGPSFIDGRFANLPHGGRVILKHDGIDYPFVANYHGGTGNDLILQWAGTRVLTWGYNLQGQLGDGTTTGRSSPGAISHDSGFQPDSTCTALASGYLHTLALCSDGSLFSWGYNVQGQLGDGGQTQSSLPTRVDSSGVLAGKTVISIACGAYHNLALCADGTLAAWGYNNHGQLGTGDTATRTSPARVARTGALAGKEVVGIAAGAYHSVALCSDGTMVAWGFNDDGELGNGTTTRTTDAVAVDRSGTLVGKTVIAIAAGSYHTLALCSDGTLRTWGYNKSGQCGVPGPANQVVPLALDSSGSLVGKRVTQFIGGGMHSLAITEDGSIHAWGANNHGQLGRTTSSQSGLPETVTVPATFKGGAASSLAAGAHHSMTKLSDGSFLSWGANSYGQLGDGTNTNAWTASVGKSTAPFIFLASSSSAMHGAAVSAIPLATDNSPIISSLATTGTIDLEGDHDNDGIPNLIEYAFGLDHTGKVEDKLPKWEVLGDHMEATFTQPPGVSAVEYAAEWSQDLQDWNPVPDSGQDDLHIYRVKIPSSGSLFLRFKVVAE